MNGRDTLYNLSDINCQPDVNKYDYRRKDEEKSDNNNIPNAMM